MKGVINAAVPTGKVAAQLSKVRSVKGSVTVTVTVPSSRRRVCWMNCASSLLVATRG